MVEHPAVNRTVVGSSPTLAATGYSAAWLARLHGVQEVAGSSPAIPTRTTLDSRFD